MLSGAVAVLAVEGLSSSMTENWADLKWEMELGADLINIQSIYEEYICDRRLCAAIGRISKFSDTFKRRLRNDRRFCVV